MFMFGGRGLYAEDIDLKGSLRLRNEWPVALYFVFVLFYQALTIFHERFDKGLGSEIILSLHGNNLIASSLNNYICPGERLEESYTKAQWVGSTRSYELNNKTKTML